MSEELKVVPLTECLHPKCSCTTNCMFEEQQRYIAPDNVVVVTSGTNTDAAKLAKVRDLRDAWAAAGGIPAAYATDITRILEAE